MADVRVTLGRRSRTSGDQVGVQVSTFGLDRLLQGVTGEKLAQIGHHALQPALEQAHSQWAVDTGASRDSIELATVEVGERHARVILQAGGEKLESDPRNKSHRDYVPFLEFNGSPSGSMAAGTLRNAVYDNDTEIRRQIHEGVRLLVEELTK